MKNYKKIRIGIDLDKIFVSSPPLVPEKLIEKLYKIKNGQLLYRMPDKLEQKIRILSHSPKIRRPIKHNILALENLYRKKNIELYLVSGRFSFLEKRSLEWFAKNNILKFFKGKSFNFNDEQPHLFKNRILKEKKIQYFIDDDLDLLLFLAEHNPTINFFWLSNDNKKITFPTNIKKVKDLEEFRITYLENHKF